MATTNYPALVAKFIGRGVTLSKEPSLPTDLTDHQFQVIKRHAMGLTAHGKPRKREFRVRKETKVEASRK